MGASPEADVRIDEAVVRALADTVPELAGAPLRFLASGWDNEMWRVGEDLVLRLPRRQSAARLVEHEAWALPRITSGRIPQIAYVGAATSAFPHSWLVQKRVPGSPATAVPRPERTAWAAALATVFTAVHAADVAEAPANPVRGCDLAHRSESVSGRLSELRPADAAVVRRAFTEGVSAPLHAGEPVLVHGDPHPANIVVHDGALGALIDFGDVTAGDPAVDLAAAWLVFDAHGRDVFRAALPGHDDATWTRARGWAAVIASALLSASDDRPDLLTCGRETVSELAQSRASAA